MRPWNIFDNIQQPVLWMFQGFEDGKGFTRIAEKLVSQ